jgi:Flp pilus assembly protein TadG
MTARLMRFLRRTEGQPGDRGSMAIEIVVLTPILLAFTLLVVAGGRLVARQGDVDSAARDAARAASIERTPDDAARAVAQTVADSSLPQGLTCLAAKPDTSNWVPGGSVGVTIQCKVSYAGLGLIGLQGSAQIEGHSVAPLDQFRRTE